MKIGIIGGLTGNGHVSVLNTLRDEFELQNVQVECYPDFYEKILLSNKILSDYYNFLLSNSIALCNKYCEFTNIVKYDVSEDFYNGVREKIIKFIQENKFEILVSVIHTVNPAIIRIIKELNMNSLLKFVIVITDPFIPIAVGYAVPGADRYYCATPEVKQYLIQNKVAESKIKVLGYPINRKFHVKNDVKKTDRTILINCGSQGNISYFEFLKMIVEKVPEYKILMVCGKNKVLYKQSYRYIAKNKLTNKVNIYGFVDQLDEILNKASIVLTKPGANSVFEAINCRVPLLIDATEGFIYQEKGIQTFLKKHRIGEILDNKDEISEVLNKMLHEDNYIKYIQEMKKIKCANGGSEIVKDVLNLQSDYRKSNSLEN